MLPFTPFTALAALGFVSSVAYCDIGLRYQFCYSLRYKGKRKMEERGNEISDAGNDREVEQCRNRQHMGGMSIHQAGLTLIPNATSHLQHITPPRSQAIDLDKGGMSMNINSPPATTRITTLGELQHKLWLHPRI